MYNMHTHTNPVNAFRITINTMQATGDRGCLLPLC